MARVFLNGIAPANTAILPAASGNSGVLLTQGGKLWFSNGLAWLDLTAAGGSPQVFVQVSRPAGLGPWEWWVKDSNGNVTDLIIADGT